MRSFEYYTPTKVLFGKDTHLKIGELLKDYNCHKVLIHYGSESAVKSGLIHEISKCLTEAPLPSAVHSFLGLRPSLLLITALAASRMVCVER